MKDWDHMDSSGNYILFKMGLIKLKPIKRDIHHALSEVSWLLMR